MADFIQATSLQSFFFEELEKVNQRHVSPVPKKLIFYASLMMEQYALAQNYFEEREGKVREKILGVKLLETEHMQGKMKKTALRDIGDTSLVLCGSFSDSLKKKIVDESYYQQIGTQAYKKLDALEPRFLNQISFFSDLARLFSKVTAIMSVVFKESLGPRQNDYLLKRSA